jgi:hypothetical protein
VLRIASPAAPRRTNSWRYTARYTLISNTPRVEDSAGSHSPLLAGFNRDARCKPTPSFLALEYQNSANNEQKKLINLSQVARLFLFYKEENLCKTNFVKKIPWKMEKYHLLKKKE